MSYCPECGEQVAKIDVFCPFCGISLKPVSGADDAMSETIVGMPPVLNTPADQQTSMPSPSLTPPVVPEEAAAPEKSAGQAATGEATSSPNFTAGDTSENWTMKTESVEVPGDVMRQSGVPLEDVFEAGPQDQIPAPPTPYDDIPTPSIIEKPEFTFEDSFDLELGRTEPGPTQAAPVPKTEDPFLGELEDEWATPPPPSSSSLDSAEAAQKTEKPGGEIPPPPPADQKPQDIYSQYVDEETDPELIRTMKHTPENVSEYGEAISQKISKKKSDSAASTEPEAPISMPAVPLEAEVQEEPSRFDSVQIIQKEEIREDKPFSAGEPKPIAVPGKKAEPPVHSPTTPNIGSPDTDGRKAAKLKPLDEGTVLNGRYEIVRKIGGGGMGAVYLANDRNLGGVLRAVKEMVQSYIESDQHDKAISDFKRESLLLTSLDHPAIPTIFDYFFDDKEGRFYLVMKYISGGDLAGRLRAAPEGRLDEKTVTEWAIQIADVLDYLHNHEPVIVYRDLKPANVMIDGNSGRVMLIDFGIARWVSKEEKGVTAVGTMGYAPPELFSGNVEPRSDIYSLGSTMFHLLTGADPQSNPLLIFDFQKNPRPRQINSQLSDQMERILMRAVEYNAEARFASAAELRDELKDHLINLKAGKVTYGVKVAPSSLAFSEQSVFCGFCGKQIVATDVFCAFCGAQQPIAQHSFSQSNFVQPVLPKLSIVGTGDLDSTVFKLEKNDNLIGRRDPMSNIFPEIDLSKYDPQTKISRRHARVWREGNSFLVEDLGSSNGTTLLPALSDSIRLLPHQPHTLTNGDRIRVGDTMLHFTVG
jgi:eukaryotic-like serine/threonine-protein kinase